MNEPTHVVIDFFGTGPAWAAAIGVVILVYIANEIRLIRELLEKTGDDR